MVSDEVHDHVILIISIGMELILEIMYSQDWLIIVLLMLLMGKYDQVKGFTDFKIRGIL